MYLSNNQMIAHTVEQSLRETDDTKVVLSNMQVVYSFMYNHYMLLTIALGAIASYLVVLIEGAPHLIITTIWSLIGLVLVGCLFFYGQQLRRTPNDKINIKKIHTYMMVSSFLTALFVGAGSFITLEYHGLPVTQLNYAHTGYYFFLSIINIVAIACLGSRLLYFMIFLIVSNISLALFILSDIQVLFQTPYIYVYILGFLGFLVIATREEKRARDRTHMLHIDHIQALHESEVQKELTDISKIQLQNEIHQRKLVEANLQNSRKELEEKITERTQYIETINSNLIRSKRNLEMAHEAAGMASWDWDVEKRELTGKNFDNLLGYSPKKLKATADDPSIALHPEDIDTFRTHIKNIQHGKQEKLDIECRMKSAYDEWLWIAIKGIAISQDTETKRIKRVVGVCRDITIERNISESLSLSNTVFEQSAEAIFVLNADLNYVSVNPRFEQVMGYSHDEIKGRHLFIDNASKFQQGNYRTILETLKESGQYIGEISEKNKAGKRLFLHLSINAVYNDDNEVSNYIGIFSDLTQQTKDRQQLSYLANYDPLTDLPNRTFFNQQLHTLLTEKSDKFAVIRLNIDRFRILNNSLGSKNADLLLKHISERLSHLDYTVRALARIGGDDFAVLLSHLSLHSLKEYVDTILSSFKQPFVIEGQEVSASLSIGVSLYPQHGHQVDKLMNRAEQALKRAKLNGGNDYFIFSQGLHVSSLDQLQLENELRRAIAHGELVVFYQPKVDLKTNSLVGFEALVRWHHETKGLLLPSDFIHLAAETGLINDLTVEVLSQTCQQIRKWRDAGFDDVKVAVNIEAKQLKRGNFLSMLDTVLAQSNIDGKNLEVEITESSLMDMPEKIKPLLTSIKSRDIAISLDDFGTGYSSLAYLSEYPIDVLKIDRSFISNVSTSKQSAAIVRAIIAMGHSLGMTLVAEGVETADQRDFLNAEGCQIVQGYLYGKALPVMEATNVLKTYPSLPPKPAE